MSRAQLKANQEARLAEHLTKGEFYEYTLSIKQIFMKYKMKRRIAEMQELIKKSMEDLGNKGKGGLMCDIFEIYYKEHVLKSRGSEEDTAKVED